MQTNIYPSFFEENVAGKPFVIAGVSNKAGNLTKIYIDERVSRSWITQDLPLTELVDHRDAILHDTEIDLVLIPQSQKDNLELVSAVLTTGKNLRIV